MNLHLNRLVMGSAVALSVVGAGLMSTPVAAQDCVTIYGGDIMNETVIDLSANAGTAISDASAGSFNTLVAAVKAAGLVDTLSGKGPFTVFAPTNDAFDGLPKGTVDMLLKPENKKKLAGILTYHVVPGTHTAKDIMAAIKKGGGKVTFKTANGDNITATMDGEDLVITDAKGGTSEVTVGDVIQSNGVIHVVDKVLLPG